MAQFKTEIKNLKDALKIAREDLYDYKNNPKRKDDLYISIDKDGEIWLIDAITRKNLIKISFENYQNILASLTFANVRYFFYKDSKKSLQTVRKIRTTKN
jgi:hypothetical protein